MMNPNSTLSQEELLSMIDSDDASLKAYFHSLPHAADIKEFLDHADINQWPRLLRLIEDPDQRAEVVSLLDEHKWEELVSYLSPKETASLIGQMESDDATDFLGELSEVQQQDILQHLPQLERNQFQNLLQYPADSAGGIMQLERAQVSVDAQVADAIQTVRSLVEDDIDVFRVWVVDHQGHLVGFIPVTDLLLHKANTPVESMMDTDVVMVKPEVDQEEVAQLFKKYDLTTLPVVDAEERLLGSISIDDVVDVLSEEAEEDALKMGGASSEELDKTEEVLASMKLRFPWLIVTLICSLISGLLIKAFDGIIQQVIIAASFIPVITAMGGNVGTQTATVLIRGFATGKVNMEDIPAILYKEIRVGLLVGSMFGILGGLVGGFLFTHHNWVLGGVICMAMLVAMTTASTMGVLAPALLKKFNFDPAVAAGPFVTTLNDITGIVIYMSIVTLFLSRLVG